MTDVAWATVGLSVATVLVAIAAAFPQIRGWIWKPELEILPIKVSPPDCHKIPTRYGADAFYFRFRVENKGRVPARSVEVFAESLTRQLEDGSLEKVNRFLPMNLLWAHINLPYYPIIPPGTSRLCGLGHIIDPSKRGEIREESNPRLEVQDNEAILSLDVMTKPNSYSYLIPKGVYRLTLSVAAENAKPVTQVVQVEFPGTWDPDEDTMLTKGLGIRLVA